MKEKFINISKLLHPTRLSSVGSYLLKDEAISSKLIFIALALALIAANSPLSYWYGELLHTKITLGVGELSLSLDIQHWINEGLMTFFFLVVGLELKREIVRGELRRKESAMLPFAAAIGGMIVPALLYIVLNANSDTIHGWAIPTATDIALAVGVLALLGNRIPPSIRIFLLALAIVDDILSVIVITIFYSTDIAIIPLILTVLVAGTIYLVGKFKTLPMWGFVTGGIILWLLMVKSGIHPSIAGALLGLIAPIASAKRPGDKVAERTERAMIPFTTLIVIPLFAFVNMGIRFDVVDVPVDTIISLSSGIIIGLVIGKFLGIIIASWLMVRLRLAVFPEGANWWHLAGVGFLSGIGFTVAIFVTELAFDNHDYITIAKISIFIASIVAGIIGLVTLKKAIAKE